MKPCNIEFSCRPESDDHTTLRRIAFCLNKLHPGGQLQRFVMTTIRVMACTERASLKALATKATGSFTFRFSTASLATALWKEATTRQSGAQSSLRASNSGGRRYAITENSSRSNISFFFRRGSLDLNSMAWRYASNSKCAQVNLSRSANQNQ